MNYGKLGGLIEELKTVEEDIKAISEFAQALVDGEIEPGIELQGKKDKTPEVQYDSDIPPMIQGFLADHRNQMLGSKTTVMKISYELDQKLTLEVLALLRKAKIEYKTFLTNKINQSLNIKP